MKRWCNIVVNGTNLLATGLAKYSSSPQSWQKLSVVEHVSATTACDRAFSPHYLIVGSTALSIPLFPFIWQKQLFQYLQQEFPDHLHILLKEFQHQYFFNQLKEDINRNQTLRLMLEKLQKLLLLSGERKLGTEEYAHPLALVAVKDYFDWFNDLPRDVQDEMSKLTYSDKTLSSITTLLIRGGDCVELIAEHIQRFLESQQSPLLDRVFCFDVARQKKMVKATFNSFYAESQHEGRTRYYLTAGEPPQEMLRYDMSEDVLYSSAPSSLRSLICHALTLFEGQLFYEDRLLSIVRLTITSLDDVDIRQAVVNFKFALYIIEENYSSFEQELNPGEIKKLQNAVLEATPGTTEDLWSGLTTLKRCIIINNDSLCLEEQAKMCSRFFADEPEVHCDLDGTPPDFMDIIFDKKFPFNKPENLSQLKPSVLKMISQTLARIFKMYPYIMQEDTNIPEDQLRGKFLTVNRHSTYSYINFYTYAMKFFFTEEQQLDVYQLTKDGFSKILDWEVSLFPWIMTALHHEQSQNDFFETVKQYDSVKHVIHQYPLPEDNFNKQKVSDWYSNNQLGLTEICHDNATFIFIMFVLYRYSMPKDLKQFYYDNKHLVSTIEVFSQFVSIMLMLPDAETITDFYDVCVSKSRGFSIQLFYTRERLIEDVAFGSELVETPKVLDWSRNAGLLRAIENNADHFARKVSFIQQPQPTSSNFMICLSMVVAKVTNHTYCKWFGASALSLFVLLLGVYLAYQRETESVQENSDEDTFAFQQIGYSR